MNLYKMVFTFNNILITGGCGFIGSNFINYIFNNYSNKRIINIDRLDISSDIKNVDIESNKENDYNFFKVDISNVDFIYHLLTFYNIDTIVHFAAQTHVDNSFCNSI
jgi:dTDP-D-glucose 4,6-dehydratase